MSTIDILITAFLLVMAVVAIFKPFCGLFMLVLIHFTQPGEMIPVLNSMRIELVYASIVMFIFLFRIFSGAAARMNADPILKPLTRFMLVAALTIPGSFWVGGSIDSWEFLLKIAIFAYFMKVFVHSAGELKAMLWLQVSVLAWLACSGMWAFNAGDTYNLHYSLGNISRAQGINSIAGGPNELAGLLVALLPYLYALFTVVKNIFVRLLLLTIAGIAFAMIMLAGSRAAVISLLLVGAVHVFTAKKKALAALAVIAIAATVWQLTPAVYQARYMTAASYAEGGKLDDSNELRLRIWKAGERMFFDHPILGVGLGQFPTAYGTKYSGVAHGAWMNPHNLPLQVACETGIIGFIFYFFFIWRIHTTNKALLRFTGEDAALTRAVAVACNATFIGVIGLSCVSHTLMRPYWYFLAGLVIANNQVTSRAASLLQKSSGAEVSGEVIARPQLVPSVVG